ncbi:MAG: AI-2E family transporter [Firmicutes bacterium]|nr:AI-2E family transporter [Bacillota bacterium]
MSWRCGKKNYWIILAAVLTVWMAYFIYLLRGIFLSLILAVVITYLCYPLVRAVERKGLPRTGAIFIVYAALFFIVAGLVLFGMPRIIAQLYRVAEVAPGYAVQGQEFIAALQIKYTHAGIPEMLRRVIDARIGWLESILVQKVEWLSQALLGLAGYIFNIILAPGVAFYLLKDIEFFTGRAVSFIPPASRLEVLALGSEISSIMDSYVRGYLLVSLLVGLLTGLAMAALKMDFALTLGIIAGLTNLIPYFGPLIGAIPAIVLAMLVSKWMVLKVVIVYLVIQQIDAALITPRVLGKRVGLHPLFVILALLAGAQLYGFTGLILSVPLLAVLRAIFIFVSRKLMPEER